MKRILWIAVKGIGTFAGCLLCLLSLMIAGWFCWLVLMQFHGLRFQQMLNRLLHPYYIVTGGAWDQTGLQKILAFALLPLLAFLVLRIAVAIRFVPGFFQNRTVRWIVGFFFTCLYLSILFAAFVYTWELFRYIAVMGITPRRIVGVRIAFTLFAVATGCQLLGILGGRSVIRILVCLLLSLVIAGLALYGINKATRYVTARNPPPSVREPGY